MPVFKFPDGRAVEAPDLAAANRWAAKNPAPEGPEEPPQPKAPAAAISAAPKRNPIDAIFTDALMSKGIQPTETQIRMNRQMMEGAMGGGLSSAGPTMVGAAKVAGEFAPQVTGALKGGAEALYGGLLKAKDAALKKTPTLVQDLLKARVPITPAGAAKVAATGDRAQAAALGHALQQAPQGSGSVLRDFLGAMGGMSFGFPKTTAAVIGANRLLRTPSTGSRVAIGLNEVGSIPYLDQASKGALLALLGTKDDE